MLNVKSTERFRLLVNTLSANLDITTSQLLRRAVATFARQEGYGEIAGEMEKEYPVRTLRVIEELLD